MMGTPRGHRTRTAFPRSGFVLPFVIVVLAVVGLCALALATVTWRDAQATARVAEAQRLSMMADEAIARSLDRWRQDSLWAHALNTPFRSELQLTAHDRQSVLISRSHPQVATVRVTASHHDPRTRYPVRRELLRTVWLEPPVRSLPAALMVHGHLSAEDPTHISGSDLRVTDTSCGDLRDTLSVRSIAADSIQSGTTPWSLRPPDAWTNAVNSPVPLSLGLQRIASAAAALGAIVLRDTQPAPLDTRPDNPSRAWQLLSLQASPPAAAVRLSGRSRFRGLLVIDGDLIVEGGLELDGLLWVRGTLEARPGVLEVSGALIVLGDAAPGHPPPSQPVARLGGRTTVRFDRCLAQMALATIAEPRSAPFVLWQTGPP